MSKLDILNIFKNPSNLFLVGFYFFFNCCSNQDSENYYRDHIPSLSKSVYHELNEFNIITDTLHADIWFSQDSVSDVNFRRIGGIKEVAENKIWITDVLLGYIYEFDSTGVYSKEVARSGEGPREFNAPLLIDVNKEENLISVLDTKLKFVSIFDVEGNEVLRFTIKSIPPSFQVNDFKYISSNNFILPTLQEEDYLIFSYDSLGNKGDGYIDRMVPIGMQPLNYNSVYFDFKDSVLTYAYDGIPLIFIKKNMLFSVLNLLPESQLDDINVPLEFKPLTESVSVRKIIKGIFLHEDSIYVFFADHFFLIPQNLNGQIKKIYLYDSEKKVPIYFHDVEFSNNNFYMINRYHSTIHKFAKN